MGREAPFRTRRDAQMIAAATLYGFAGFCAAALLVYLVWALVFAEDL